MKRILTIVLVLTSLVAQAQNIQFKLFGDTLKYRSGTTGLFKPVFKPTSTGVTSGTYGSGTSIPRIVVGSDGRLTYAGTTNVTIPVSVTNNNQLTNGAGYLDALTGVPIGTYNTNRTTDQAATATAQAKADAALPTTTYNTNRTTDQVAVNANAIKIAGQKISRVGTYAGRKVVAFGSRLPTGNVGEGFAKKQIDQVTTRSHYKAIGNISDLSIVLLNDLTAGYNKSDGVALVITASIEYTYIPLSGSSVPGTIQQITFNSGATSYTLGAKKTVVSDVIQSVEIPDGADFWIRTCVTVPAGTSWYATHVTTASNSEGAVTGSDLTLSGSIPNSTSYAYQPVAVIGNTTSRRASVILNGTSISAGTGDPLVNQYGINTGGIYGRSFQNLFPTLAANVPGDKILGWVPAGRPQLSQILPLADLFLNELAINDLQATLTTLQSAEISLWDSYMARGVYGYQTTITPYTTSTDGWLSAANQTVTTNESKRVAFNDWIRDGAPLDAATRNPQAVGSTGSTIIRAGQLGHPLLGYFELADLVETSRNSGKFKTASGVAITTDGLHYNGTGYALLAPGIDTSKFLLW